MTYKHDMNTKYISCNVLSNLLLSASSDIAGHETNDFRITFIEYIGEEVLKTLKAINTA